MMNISHPNLETQSRPTSSNLSKSKSQSKSKSKSKSIDSSNHHHQHSINNANFLQQAHHMYNCPTATHNNNNNIASPHKYSMTKSHVLSSNFLYGSNSLNNTINHTYSNYNGDLLIHNKEKEKKNDKSVSQFNNCQRSVVAGYGIAERIGSLGGGAHMPVLLANNAAPNSINSNINNNNNNMQILLHENLVTKNHKLSIMIRQIHGYMTHVQELDWILKQAEKIMKNYIKNTVEKDNIKTKTKSKSMNINSALINKENIRSNIDLNYPKNISTKIAPISMQPQLSTTPTFSSLSHKIQIQNIYNQLLRLINRFSGIDKKWVYDMTIPLKQTKKIFNRNAGNNINSLINNNNNNNFKKSQTIGSFKCTQTQNQEDFPQYTSNYGNNINFTQNGMYIQTDFSKIKLPSIIKQSQFEFDENTFPSTLTLAQNCANSSSFANLNSVMNSKITNINKNIKDNTSTNANTAYNSDNSNLPKYVQNLQTSLTQYEQTLYILKQQLKTQKQKTQQMKNRYQQQIQKLNKKIVICNNQWELYKNFAKNCIKKCKYYLNSMKEGSEGVGQSTNGHGHDGNYQHQVEDIFDFVHIQKSRNNQEYDNNGINGSYTYSFSRNKNKSNNINNENTDMTNIDIDNKNTLRNHPKTHKQPPQSTTTTTTTTTNITRQPLHNTSTLPQITSQKFEQILDQLFNLQTKLDKKILQNSTLNQLQFEKQEKLKELIHVQSEIKNKRQEINRLNLAYVNLQRSKNSVNNSINNSNNNSSIKNNAKLNNTVQNNNVTTNPSHNNNNNGLINTQPLKPIREESELFKLLYVQATTIQHLI